MTHKLIGIGDAGCDYVTRVHWVRLQDNFYQTIAINDDWQPLSYVGADKLVRLETSKLSRGNPMIGRQIGEANKDLFYDLLAETEHLILTTGMGGGLGSGMAHVLAYVAKELRIPTLAVVSLPFDFESQKRKTIADLGIKALSKFVDDIVIVDSSLFIEMEKQKHQAFNITDPDDYYFGLKAHMARILLGKMRQQMN